MTEIISLKLKNLVIINQPRYYSTPIFILALFRKFNNQIPSSFADFVFSIANPLPLSSIPSLAAWRNPRPSTSRRPLPLLILKVTPTF